MQKTAYNELNNNYIKRLLLKDLEIEKCACETFCCDYPKSNYYIKRNFFRQKVRQRQICKNIVFNFQKIKSIHQ